MFKGHLDHIKAVALAPDGKTAFSASLDGTIRMWRRGNIWSRDMQDVIEGSWGPVHTMALSPDGARLAFGGLDQTVRLYVMRAKGLQKAAVLRGHLGVRHPAEAVADFSGQRLLLRSRHAGARAQPCDGRDRDGSRLHHRSPSASRGLSTRTPAFSSARAAFRMPTIP